VLALPYVARDFHVAPAALAGPLAVLQFATIAAIPLNRLADRRGRRNVLVLSALVYTVANLGSAFAPNLGTLFATRAVAKLAGSAEVTLAFVILSEELPAHSRGAGLSVLAAFTALGGGVAALLLPFVGGPFAWRWLYLGTLPALALVILLRLRLRETRRFLSLARRPEPLKVLMHPPYRRRALVLGAFFLITTLPTPAATFISSYALGSLHLRPAELTALIFLAGGAALIGYLVGGQAADVLGRRAVMVLTTATLSGAIFLMYGLGVPGLWVGSVAGAFLVAAGTPAFSAYTNELFPTAARATANALAGTAAVLGGAIGLAAVAFLGAWAGLQASILWLALPPLPALLLIRLLPETARRELSEVAPEPW
jgi:MFS family permease